MSDLTIIFLTVNLVPEKWARYHKKKLLEAADSSNIITISKEPLNWGQNYIQDEPVSENNIYKQILNGCKIANTPFVAIAEDDTLYTKEHFHSFRPTHDSFAYNLSCWGLLTWGPPTYYWSNKLRNLSLIAPRKLAIESLEERFAKSPTFYGELGHPKIESRLGLEPRKHMTFFSKQPIVYFQHDHGLDRLEREHKKQMSNLRSFEIPFWGKSKQLVKKFR
ncbi:MAG: hypothetical protein WA152_00995 [Microgenomates group bacterium]